MQIIIEINGKIMKMVFIYFYGRLTLAQNALQSNVKWVKIRNLSGWVAFHGIFNINLI